MITTRPHLRQGAVAAIVVAGLMLVGVACGGSSSKTVTDAVTGNNECAKFSEKLDKAMSNTSSSSASGMDDLTTLYKDLDSMTSSVPSAIRGDWKVYVDFFKQYADAMKGVNLDNLMSDPAAMQRMTDAMSKLNDPKYQTAMNNLTAYFSSGCTTK